MQKVINYYNKLSINKLYENINHWGTNWGQKLG